MSAKKLLRYREWMALLCEDYGDHDQFYQWASEFLRDIGDCPTEQLSEKQQVQYRRIEKQLKELRQA
jgi:hypothetical protein